MSKQNSPRNSSYENSQGKSSVEKKFLRSYETSNMHSLETESPKRKAVKVQTFKHAKLIDLP